MKRLMAMLLTGCMLVQSLSGSAVVALGAETGEVVALADGEGAAADTPAGDLTAADTGGDVELGTIEEISPDDSAAVPDVSGEDFSQGSSSEGEDLFDFPALGDEIIDEIELVDPAEVSGAPDGPEEPTEESVELSEGEILQIDAADTTKEGSVSTKGRVEVTVASGLPFYPENGLTVNVGVRLAGSNTPESKQVTLDEAKTKGVAAFDVEPGDYIIEVDASKFASYKQNVTVGTRELVKINVSTARSEAVKGEDNKETRVGWLRLGDVENAGVVDHNDIDQILAAIRGENVGTIDADLNENGKVDIADLQMAMSSYYLYQKDNADKGENEEDKTHSTVERQQLPLAVKEDENTKVVSGDLNSLLMSAAEGEDEAPAKPVTLQPAKDEAISPSNPVQISFDLAVEGTAEANLPKVEGMTIKAPVTADGTGENNNNIGAGTVEVTGIVNGTEAILEVPMAASESASPVYYEIPEAAEDITVTVAEDGLSVEAPVPEEIADVAEAEDIIAVQETDAAPETAADEEVMPAGIQAAELGETAGAAAAADLPRIKAEKAKATVAKDGSLVLDFGTQVAVKKVTIKITGTTQNNGKLVDIAKVEFVNDMASRIPEPEMNTPANLRGEPGNEEFTVKWDPQQNVTGYELEVRGHVKKTNDEQTQTIRVSGTEYLVVSIKEYSLKNFTPYTVRVRSVNGEWSSPWSEAVVVTPKPVSRPDPVDNLTVRSGYRSLILSWKDMKDANGYMVYYKEKKDGSAADSAADYKPVVDGFVLTNPSENASEAEREATGKDRITSNTYTITGLEDNKTYYVYVIGWNELGWGQNPPPTDKIQYQETTNVNFPQLPKYHAINLPADETKTGEVTPHITAAWRGWAGENSTKATSMVQSPLDEEGGKGNPDPTVSKYTAWGTVDNNYESYWTRCDWDDGVSYGPGGYEKGITIQFDGEYQMSYLTFSALDIMGETDNAAVYYWNTENGAKRQLMPTTLLKKNDKNGHRFYLAKFNKDIKANKIQLCIGRGYGDYQMKIAEIRFYSCDDLYNNIMGLYADDMHVVLQDTHPLLNVKVDEALIAKLRADLEVEENGEKHPLYDSLKLELDNAEELLKDAGLTPVKVNTGITSNGKRDSHLGFGGLNAWQPLGKAAAAGETLVVYVGHNNVSSSKKGMGDTADLKMVFTQYHAQSDALSFSVGLKIGRNEITVPQIRNESRELGGQVYVEYTGNNAADEYEIRVSGGSDIPVLNLYKKTGAEKTEAIQTYVEALEKYVGEIETKHNELLASAGDKWKESVDHTYNERNCFLNATDLMMEHMMYSVPALQVWNGIKGANPAQQLEASLDAMEKTMTLFYQHKGLSSSAAAQKNGNNALPIKHLNIRYMTMFSGAFMYASGNHIGVEYPETIMAGGASSWDSFGWGVAHEIGHDINQSCYAIAEITNNYFAQLLTKATKGTRFKYEDIYKKVTSGALGRSSNVGTQLGLYWQLHLAYDGYKDDRHIFGDGEYDEMFRNLFFARVDTYARNPGKAKYEVPASNNVDQTLMRLACAAAEENILPFFERWGMVPDTTTEEYAKKYGDPTKKALYYVNDDARDYRVDHPDAVSTVKDKNVVTAAATAENNVVKINISTTAGDDLLGYEISRSMYDRGHLQDEQVVGFQLASAGSVYTDTVSTINNRVMYYKVRAVDKFLNYSNAADAGSVKIETGGALNKDEWSIQSTTMESAEDSVAVNPGGEAAYDKNSNADPDSGYNENNPASVTAKKTRTIDRVIDGDSSTVYTGNAGGEIVIDMGKASGISSLRYIGTDPSQIFVTKDNNPDGAAWTNVKESGITADAIVKGADENSYKTIWFDAAEKEAVGSWIGTYDARYVKLVYTQAVSIREIEVCGPSGDNVEFKTTSGAEVGRTLIGKLKESYRYADGEGYEIPAGSLIFTGTYKGNPAFNVVILYDKNGNVVGVNKEGTGVKAEQVIFANVPENGSLGTTSDGTWLYYVEPDNYQSALEAIKANGGQIRAELYRADDAETLAGERLVSDTKLYTIENLDNLPEISLTGGQIPNLKK